MFTKNYINFYFKFKKGNEMSNIQPTLIIGIGGIGCRIAYNVRKQLESSNEGNDHIGVIGIDTNENDLELLRKNSVEIRTIRISDKRKVNQVLNDNKEYMQWFPSEKILLERSIKDGAGQIRALSRLAFTEAVKAGKFKPIEDEITRIRNLDQTGDNISLAIMIVGSITGGTGAGLFIQLPLYVRELLKKLTGDTGYIIRGMFISPEITEESQPATINKEAVHVNAYACIKELNAMYLMQNPSYSDRHIVLEYFNHNDDAKISDTLLDMEAAVGDSVPKKSQDTLVESLTNNHEIPYDYLYFIEKNSAQGSLDLKLESFEKHVAQMVYTILFTRIRNAAFSVEDNTILQSIANGGMDRYAGAGLSRIIYPHEIAQKYITLSIVKKNVNGLWLILDEKVNNRRAHELMHRGTNGAVRIPEIYEMYIDEYAKAVRGEIPALTYLRREGYSSSPDGLTEKSKAEDFLGILENVTRNIVSSPDIEATNQGCKCNTAIMNSEASATKEINRVLSKLAEFKRQANIVIENNKMSIAENMMPIQFSSMEYIDQEKSIKAFLEKVHPVTARFICYDIISKLKERIKELEGRVPYYDLDAYLSYDFDQECDGVQNATTAIRKAATGNFIKKIFNKTKGEIEEICREFEEQAETQCNQLKRFMSDSIELSNAKELLKRVKIISENYEIFFKNIKENIEETSRELERLAAYTLPPGNIGVYCTVDAFNSMVSECEANGMEALPESVTESIFKTMYKNYSWDYSDFLKELSDDTKKKRLKKKQRKFKKYFESDVVAKTHNELMEKCNNIIDINVRDALIKEMQLNESVRAEAPDFENAADAYIKDAVTRAMRMAAPLVAVQESAQGNLTESIYMAINPECAKRVEDQPDEGETRKSYTPAPCAETDNIGVTPLIDEKFLKHEIICMKLRYKLKIEELTKYLTGSQTYQHYVKRIDNLTKNINLGSDNSVLVNPHLNCYWHQIGFIPSLTTEERDKDERNIQKAFIYAMGYDVIFKGFDEFGNLKWRVKKATGSHLLEKCEGTNDCLENTEYSSAYEALYFNREAVKRILGIKEIKVRNFIEKNDTQKIYDEILSNEFISDLIHNTSAEEDDENILVILLKMLGHMRNGENQRKWQGLFNGLYLVLFEFCDSVFGNDRVRVRNGMITILKEMYRIFSEIVDREEKYSPYDVNAVTEQYHAVLNKVQALR